MTVAVPIPATGSAHSASAFDDIFDGMLRALGYDPTTSNVLRTNAWGLNTLAVSGVASPLDIATGAAIVNGKLIKVTAAETEAVATPAAATRIDRIVINIDYTSTPEVATIARVAGAEGGAAPALTQTDGTTWQVSLAQASITTAGVITVTDERTYLGDAALAASAAGRARMADAFFDAATALAKFGADSLTNAVLLDAVQDGAFVADAATRALFAAGFVDAGLIANRTREVEIQCTGGWNVTSDAEIDRTDDYVYGFPLDDNIITDVFGSVTVPKDYVSDGVIIPVIYAGGTGDLYGAQHSYYAASGETPTDNPTAATTQALTDTKLTECTSLQTVFSSEAAGDHISLVFRRDAWTGVTDTIEANCQFVKWILRYTADS